MARKNIFQLVEENYDIQEEVRKIDQLFVSERYFERSSFDTLCFFSLVKIYLFDEWKYRGTCITVEEYLKRANAIISNRTHNGEDVIVNYLEVIENFVKLYCDNGDELFEKHNIQYYTYFDTVFCDLINTLEKRMGLSKREYKDRIILYPKNAPLEKVIDLCEEEDVQWELIRYVREDLSLTEKRKSLAYLATNLGIEEDKNEQNEHIKELVKTAGNILNNLHIRHNNKTGKWENKILSDITEEDARALCDMVYNEMLTIILLREHKEYEKTYTEFSRKQKEVKAQKKIEE